MQSKNIRMAEVHRSPTPVHLPTDGSSSNLRILHGNIACKPEIITRYRIGGIHKGGIF